LAQAARLKEVEQMIRGNPLYVDLHGYREEEIEPLLETIRDMLREQFDRRTSSPMQTTNECGPRR
jgi:hypothetical protein